MAEAIQVLHVDDEPDVAELTAEFLEREDDRLDVITETSADAGLERLAAGEIDCIVSDYQMPDMDGLAFLEEVRESHPELPFLLFTGRGSEEVASAALSSGATDYLQKRAGTEQYELLANQITNAVEGARARERTAYLEQVRTVVRDVNQALVRATAREEVETSMCDIISQPDTVAFVVFSTVDAETNRVEPQTWDGTADGEAYLDAVDLTVGEPDDDPLTPHERAVHEHEVAASQDIQADPAFDPWREAVTASGFRAVAVIPIEYDADLYGLLALYGSQSQPVDADARALLEELGGDIAQAFHAIEMQAELREERSFFDQALDALDDVFYVVRGDGTFRRWNARLAAVTGYTDEEIADMHAIEFFPEDEQGQISEAIDETLTTGSAVVEAEFLTTTGERIPYEFTGSRLVDSDGDVIGLIGIGWDITERSERERELERYGTIIRAIPDEVYTLDVDGTLTSVFPSTGADTAVTGYHPADLVGEPVSTVMDEADIATGEKAIRDLLRAEDRERTSFELDLVTKDGARIPHENHIALLPTEDEEDFRGSVGVLRDITERKEHEEALKWYKTIIEATGDQIYTLDPEGNFTYVNQALTSFWGYDENELLGTPVSRYMAEEDVEQGEALIRELLDSDDRRTGTYELTAITEDGERIPTENHLALLRDVDGTFRGTIGVLRDISMRKERAARLRRQNERLEEFASVVSHDLRNPLNVATGRLELARQECASDQLDEVAQAHDRMDALIDDLLTLAREGESVADIEPVRLAETIEGCWRTVVTGTATLTTETDRTIRADPARLQQLLENLIRNAVEHGGDAVTVTIGDLADGFYVADDGSGIPEDTREQVLERGYSTSDAGTGFGLSIVQEIATAHDWTIRVTESEAGGARIEFTGVDVAQ